MNLVSNESTETFSNQTRITLVGVGNFCVNPRFHPTDVGRNVALTRKFPTSHMDGWWGVINRVFMYVPHLNGWSWNSTGKLLSRDTELYRDREYDSSWCIFPFSFHIPNYLPSAECEMKTEMKVCLMDSVVQYTCSFHFLYYTRRAESEMYIEMNIFWIVYNCTRYSCPFCHVLTTQSWDFPGRFTNELR